VATALLPEAELQVRELGDLLGLDLSAWIEEADRIASG
jgi:hypothetical protein